MPEDNVGTVRSSYDAFYRRDLDEFLGFHDPDVEFRSLVLEVEGVYHGHEGLRAWWATILDVFPDWMPQIEDARDDWERKKRDSGVRNRLADEDPWSTGLRHARRRGTPRARALRRHPARSPRRAPRAAPPPR